TLGGNFVNEARVAVAESPVKFFAELGDASTRNTDLFANQAGFHLAFPLVTGASASPIPQGRNAWNLMIEDSVSWLRGNHSVTFGGTFTHLQTTSYNSSLVPTVNFDVLTGDPALGMFTTANFPGASTAQLTAARQMYALFTGRMSSINGDARLENGKYVYMGNAQQDGVMREAGFFLQDSWRWKPNFTVNAGLRYELQLPFYPLNNSYSTVTLESICGRSGVADRSNVEQACNMFQPGNMPGSIPEYINFGEGEYAFKVDKNNWAPSLGFAWVLGERNGILGAILGDESVLRGGYSKSFSREGLTNYTGRYASNPGLFLFNEPDRNASNGNLGPLPLLLRDPSRHGPGAFPESPSYPFLGSINDSVNRFDENIQVPWAESVSIGLQRALGRNHVVEARYVGTRSGDAWTTYNFNEPALVENGFLAEFRQAQANLQANIAAGRGATFRYFGAGTGTAPLPIYLAHFSGVPIANAGDSSLYTSSLFANSNYVNPLTMWNPNPFAPASTSSSAGLYGTPTFRANAAAAGLPLNFWVANPDKLGGAIMTGGGGKTYYNSMQLELRRRLVNGLQFNSSYVLGNAFESQRFGGGFRRPRVMRRDAGSPGDLTHAFKANIVYDLPFGRGRRFASNAGAVMERVVGGWSLGMNSRVQSGVLVELGNLRLVGMTADDVRKMYKLRINENQRVFMWPQAIIDETIKAFSLSSTSATGYGALGAPSGQYFAPPNGPDCIEVAPGFGDCGTGTLVVQGPWLQQHDIALAKRIALFGRSNLELRIEALNAFNQVNYFPNSGIGGTSTTAWEVGSLNGTNAARVLQFIGRINF
ncbi:MAG TPA: TonB-dependent receptor, partial [Vicinamibacterales bacterium]|nr:TonB-dependent receptor [Vicinamibacterales bacterium]